jgi:hypothetical protein
MLCFVPDQNTPGKFDTSGAFFPEARAFARFHGADPDTVIKRFPTHAPLDQRRATCTIALRNLQTPPLLDVVAFFCHGWKAGLQAGYMRQHALLLAQLLAQRAKLTAHVLFFACDTARDDDTAGVDDLSPGPGGDGGFADELRDACEAIGRQVTVMGHASAGHCSYNPYARYFAPGCQGKGGHWYVEPKSQHWQAWIRSLRDPRSTLRFRFWQMTPEDIADELGPRVA